VLRHAKRKIFCLDASKLGRSTPHRVAPWQQLTTLVTDAAPKHLAEQGISLPSANLLGA
jgi:DeoR/GlpR family transcriptional regulator of sugar metabolism